LESNVRMPATTASKKYEVLFDLTQRLKENKKSKLKNNINDSGINVRLKYIFKGEIVKIIKAIKAIRSSKKSLINK